MLTVFTGWFFNYILATFWLVFRLTYTVVTGLVEQCVRENASLPLNQNEYQKRYDGLCTLFESVKSRLESVTAQIADRTGRRETIEQFLTDLMKQDGVVTCYCQAEIPEKWQTKIPSLEG